MAKAGKQYKSLELFNCGLGRQYTKESTKVKLKCASVNISYNPGVEWAIPMFSWAGLQEFHAVRCELTNSQTFIKAIAGKKIEFIDASENPFDIHLAISYGQVSLVANCPQL